MTAFIKGDLFFDLDELSAAEKQELAVLRSEAEGLRELVEVLTNSKDVLKKYSIEQAESLQTVAKRMRKLEGLALMPEIPLWAVSAVNTTAADGLIDTQPGGSNDFYRILTVLQGCGLLITNRV